MTSTDERVDPLTEPRPSQDRVGLIGGLALGAVMLLVALTVALTGGSAGSGGDARCRYCWRNPERRSPPGRDAHHPIGD